MYQVKIKGEKEPILVSDERGKALYEDFRANKLPPVIDLDGAAYNAKGIYSVVKVSNDGTALKVEPRDIRDLKEKLKGIEQKKLNGRLVSRFEQYLLSTHTIRMDGGQFIVCDPIGYRRLNEVFEALQRHEYAIARAFDDM